MERTKPCVCRWLRAHFTRTDPGRQTAPAGAGGGHAPSSGAPLGPGSQGVCEGDCKMANFQSPSRQIRGHLPYLRAPEYSCTVPRGSSERKAGHECCQLSLSGLAHACAPRRGANGAAAVRAHLQAGPRGTVAAIQTPAELAVPPEQTRAISSGSSEGASSKRTHVGRASRDVCVGHSRARRGTGHTDTRPRLLTLSGWTCRQSWDRHVLGPAPQDPQTFPDSQLPGGKATHP